jgi:hypothetical protein
MSITEPPASVTAMLPAIPFGVLVPHHRHARRREPGFFDVDRGTAS